VIPNDWDFFPGHPYRLSVLLADNNANGAPVTMTSPVTVRVGPQHGALGSPIPMQIHANGPEPSYALTTYTFPEAGWYTIEAEYKGHTASTPVQVIPPSQSATPVIGGHMVSVATPTVADHRGVNPYCTQQPPCPFHAASLDAALAGRQPVALQFATPALCQSKFCGPVLMNLESVAPSWQGRVTFIHSEIYTDLSGQQSTPAVTAWGLQHEPMLYLGDADGVIVDRIDNLYDKDEVRAALTRAYGSPS
jgi:hypothetical protein